MLRTYFLPYLFGVGLILASLDGYSHDGHDHGHAVNDDDSGLSRHVLVLKSATELVPDMLSHKTASGVMPYVHVGGEKIYLNSHFWELVRGASQLYYEEIKEECVHCHVPHPEEVVEQAKELVAKGWLTHTSGRFANVAVDRYGRAFVGLGARYGVVAGVLKVVGELAEDALLVVLKMPGAHMMCEVITAALTVASSRLQTGYRAFRYGGQHHTGSWSTLVKVAYYGRKIRKAQNRVVFASPPFELDAAALELLDAQGPQKKSFFTSLEGGKRQQFLTWLKSQTQHLYEELQQLPPPKDRTWRQKIQEKTLQKKLERVQTLHRKLVEGRRYKRFFLLVSRKGSPQYLNGSTEIERSLRGPWLWVLSAEAHFLDRVIIPENEQGLEVSRFQSRPAGEEDFIRQSLAEQFVGSNDEAHKSFVSDVLNDIGLLFDSNISRNQKYMNLVSLEALMGGYLLRLSQKVNEQEWQEAVTESGLEGFKKLSLNAKYWWRSENLGYYFDQYFDFLRVVAVSPTSRFDGWAKYEAMEYFLLLLRTLSQIDVENLKEKSPASQQILDILKDQLQTLNGSRFWVPKKRVYRLFPLSTSPLRCEQLGGI
ncbi:MAG: hypothetical protein H6626_01310 [Pseudobdellovibrionaceae bacterium]|nr:MAG: hypothetical protein H6626_01310 [Pseudobdellovibrionaceae bacterium]